jgi:hypothetical protein
MCGCMCPCCGGCVSGSCVARSSYTLPGAYNWGHTHSTYALYHRRPRCVRCHQNQALFCYCSSGFDASLATPKRSDAHHAHLRNTLCYTKLLCVVVRTVLIRYSSLECPAIRPHSAYLLLFPVPLLSDAPGISGAEGAQPKHPAFLVPSRLTCTAVHAAAVEAFVREPRHRRCDPQSTRVRGCRKLHS